MILGMNGTAPSLEVSSSHTTSLHLAHVHMILDWKPPLPLEKHSRHLILLPQVLTSSTADGDHWLLQVEQQIQYETKCFLHAAHSILDEEKIVRC